MAAYLHGRRARQGHWAYTQTMSTVFVRKPSKPATRMGRVFAWIAILFFIVWIAASITTLLRHANTGRTPQSAVVDELVSQRTGTLFHCNVTITRADGVTETLRVPGTCDKAPAVGSAITVWVSDEANRYSYLDGHQDEEPTDNVMAGVFLILIPFIVVFLPAVSYLRRPRAHRT